MHYQSTDELPDGIKSSLPKKAQEVYRIEFNQSWDANSPFDQDSWRERSESRSQVAHRIAWVAVRQQFERTASGWVEK